MSSFESRSVSANSAESHSVSASTRAVRLTRAASRAVRLTQEFYSQLIDGLQISLLRRIEFPCMVNGTAAELRLPEQGQDAIGSQPEFRGGTTVDQ